MIKKDFGKYLHDNFSESLSTINEVSKDSNSNISLVKNETKVFNFDTITQNLFVDSDCTPTSVDAISIKGKDINLIEFKTGFKKKISKENRDKNKSKCERINEICEDYWDIFFKKQDIESKELITSIKFKSIESYITLEKKLFPKCIESDVNYNLNLVIVIDEDNVDSMEDTLICLSGNPSHLEKNNVYARIKKSLNRVKLQKDVNNKDYYYDKIDVYSAYEYHKLLEKV